MTNTPVPTDAELLELADVCEIRDVLKNGLVHEAELLEFSRAVLARWGATAPVSADVRAAAKAIVDHWDTPSWGYAEYTESFIRRLREALAAPPAPEVRVPLSDEQADVIALVEFERHCGMPHPWDGAQPWVIAAIKAAHGITAKEPT